MASLTTIIAEAGVNHNGDIGMAKRLIDAAAEAGADYVKFQTFSADRQVTRNAQKARYQAQATGVAESQYEMLKRLEISAETHEQLMAHCRQRNIGFLSTGFDIEAVNLLYSLGLRLFKIPSGEITNLPYLRHIAALDGEVILSTGMCSLGEVEAAIDVLEQAGAARERVTVLHCTTEYPAPLAEVNLRAMQSIGTAFGVRTGYSDHTEGIEVAIAAVALGASLIEKHFTLDRELPGPDHKASLEPRELATMIASIRNVESALGDGIKRVTESEFMNRTVARKSIVAARPIRKGERFSVDNLTAKRPGDGISPMRWDELLDKQASRDFLTDERIEL
ncbi:N-acetylneuraminate synthase [Sphingorhabdus sp.]|uniref:N-acetylneuraminate synthase n=1 Tax=Sphingorhabdus sp. TaxID=1902408 RepID=UPI0035B1A568